MTDLNDSIASANQPSSPASPARVTSVGDPPGPAPATSKSASVLKLLRRAKGASISELQEATAWQPHSVRAFLSGLRKKGSVLSKEQRKSGETTYRLASKSAPAATADA
jgi:hypothetical protein